MDGGAGQGDVILSLVDGGGEGERWERFMAALLSRTQADRGVMLIAQAHAPARQAALLAQGGASRPDAPPAIDIERLMHLRLRDRNALRAGRVYAMDEMLNFDDSAMLAHQRRALGAMGIGHGRWLRVTVEGLADAWILLTRERGDFSASAVATLSSVAPYLRAAVRSFLIESEQALLRTMAQAALERLGIGQVALDEGGRVIAADPVARRHLTFVDAPDGRSGRKMQLMPAASEDLEGACARFASARKGDAAHVLIDIGAGVTMMLQPAKLPAVPGMAHPAAIGTIRVGAREEEQRGAAVLRDQFRLSAREAALAEKLSRGEMIVEAGRQLHLTAETARNYSKRIYERTGTRGQADLVRAILSGLAPLA